MSGLMYDTFDDVFGPDGGGAIPGGGNLAVTGPSAITQSVPAHVDPIRGLRSLHPGYSPTPYLIGMVVVLALLFHPRAGFGVQARARAG